MHLRSPEPAAAGRDDGNAPRPLHDSSPAGALVALCIPTYRRNELLRQCLGAVAALALPAGWRLRVLVADNDADGGARELCAAEARRSGIDLAYCVEPRRGLSLVRNRLLEEALASGAAWIAFVDDDEQPAPDWLARHMQLLSASGADVSAGPVVQIMPGAPPPPSAPVRETAPARVPRFVACNNVVFRRALAERQGLRFDPQFNHSGGEDFDFFERSRTLGNRHVWSDGARVFETVTPDRATLRYLFHRHWSGALTRVAQERKWCGGPLLWPRFLLKSLGKLAGGTGALLLAAVPPHRPALRESVKRYASACGYLCGLLNVRAERYR